MLFRWRRQLRAGLLDTTTQFLLVALAATPKEPSGVGADSGGEGSIEIQLGQAKVCIRGTPDPATLAPVLKGFASMIGLPAGTRIWIAAGVTDMHSGFNGLAARVGTALKEEPYSGHVFVFRGRRGHLVKVLWWTGDGCACYANDSSADASSGPDQ